MVFIKYKTTRDRDLERIAVYRQAKDTALEDARKKLIEAVRRGDHQERERLENIIKKYFPNEKYWR